MTYKLTSDDDPHLGEMDESRVIGDTTLPVEDAVIARTLEERVAGIERLIALRPEKEAELRGLIEELRRHDR